MALSETICDSSEPVIETATSIPRPTGSHPKAMLQPEHKEVAPDLVPHAIFASRQISDSHIQANSPILWKPEPRYEGMILSSAHSSSAENETSRPEGREKLEAFQARLSILDEQLENSLSRWTRARNPSQLTGQVEGSGL